MTKMNHNRRTRHLTTKAEGRVTGHIGELYKNDTMGPWSYVIFDDGLECWVADSNLEPVGPDVMCIVAGDAPAFEPQPGDTITVEADGEPRFDIRFDPEGVVFGYWTTTNRLDWHRIGRLNYESAEPVLVKSAAEVLRANREVHEQVQASRDREALDAMAALFGSGDPHNDNVWPGSSGLEDLCELVKGTGRDVTTPRPGVEWRSH